MSKTIPGKLRVRIGVIPSGAFDLHSSGHERTAAE